MRSIVLGLCIALGMFCSAAVADEAPRVVPAPALDNPLAPGDPQVAVLAGGCYWGMQTIFEHVKGVTRVVAGFTGPRAIDNDGSLTHRGQVPAESVQITFDPARITYGQLLQIYFSVAHDRTQVDRQGPDRGPQYRSAIFYADNTQEKIADAYIAQLNTAHAFQSDLATETVRLSAFNRVRESEQDFAAKHPDLPYIVTVDEPRIAAMKALFPNRFLNPPLTYTE